MAMKLPRLFIAHEALEAWVSQGRAEIDAEELKDRESGRRFRLREGVRFLEEVSGEPDAAGLVGKVKDLDQLAEMGGEHMADSVVLGDNAYRVQPGFVGTVVQESAAVAAAQPKGPLRVKDLDPAAQSQTLVALQKFFLTNVK